MPKTRISIPRILADKVLKEYNHKCAICGVASPQLHHIDEDPSNNEPLNLLPLCPNCHLIDQHNPVQKFDTSKLKLFRMYKDPSILSPQFHVLFVRLQFIDHIQDDEDANELEDKAKELIEFIASLNMGNFYSKRIQELIKRPRAFIYATGSPGEGEIHAKQIAYKNREYRQRLQDSRDKIYELVVELLRFQPWSYEPRS